MAYYEQMIIDMLNIDGCMAAALVDYESGMMLAGSSKTTFIDLEIATAGNTEVIRSKTKTLSMLGIKETIEDILMTLDNQYHLLRPLSKNSDLFMYCALDRNKSNLALARRTLKEIDHQLK